MPHGSRINPQGTRHYSACMMDDTLVELDTSTFKASRHFTLTRGKSQERPGGPVTLALNRTRPMTRAATGSNLPNRRSLVLANLGAALDQWQFYLRGLQQVG